LLFSTGPLIWAPFSEVLGRRILFIITYLALTAFNAGTAGSQNIQTVVILRFFSGSFGSSPLTNVSRLLFFTKKVMISLSLFIKISVRALVFC
jgi:MFS family permease